MENQLIPFGKYKGQPLEILAQDPQYLEWVRNQSWFVEKYPQINTLIINNFQEPSETPEHNKIQGMFLDDEFCLKTVNAYSLFLKNKNKIMEVSVKNKITELKFEHSGIDVCFCAMVVGWSEDYITKEKTPCDVNVPFVIEIKPSVGDDYPAILRQIKIIKKLSSFARYILLVDQYCGKGISEENFIKLFYTEGIVVLFIRDIV